MTKTSVIVQTDAIAAWDLIKGETKLKINEEIRELKKDQDKHIRPSNAHAVNCTTHSAVDSKHVTTNMKP